MEYNDITSLIPEDGAERLNKLLSYQILDTEPEDTFDKFALLASQIINTTGAFITFVDDERVFIKANLTEWTEEEAEKNASLSALAILQDDVMVFQDVCAIPYLVDNDFVSPESGIRFFAAAPLITPEGHNVGAVCVVDDVPRDPEESQIEMLITLSRIIVDKLENRLHYKKSIETQVNIMNIALHEIKNPLASIKLANDIFTKDRSRKEKMTDMIKDSVMKIQTRLADLLTQSEGR